MTEKAMDNKEIFRLFTEAEPFKIEIRDSCHGDTDFRRTLIGEFSAVAHPVSGAKLVIKLASNGFTDAEHLEMWERLAREYRALGYFCPEILRNLGGVFPQIEYDGRQCIAWAEEFAPFETADSFENIQYGDGRYKYLDDALLMNARVASERFDFSPLPSGYTLFDSFDKNDAEPEILDVAHGWLRAATALPERFRRRAMELWECWHGVYREVRRRYGELPTSVFQADINSSNVLLEKDGGFAGVMDFNIAGRDTLLNLLMREVPYVYGWPKEEDEERSPVLQARIDNALAVRRIKYALGVVRREYRFSDAERELALPLFRCVRALWWPSRDSLEAAKTDDDITASLDETERLLVEDFGFASVMSC